MMKISNMKILYKILSCFALLGLVVGGAIWFATSKLKAIDNIYSEIIGDDVRALVAGLQVNQRAYNFARLSWRILAEPNFTEIKKLSEEIAANQKEIGLLIDEAKKHAPRLVARYDQVRQLSDSIYSDYLAVEKATIARNVDEALRLANLLVPKNAAQRTHVREINDQLEKEMRARADQATADTSQTIVVAIVSISAALAAVMALAFLLVQFGVARPIAGLVVELKKLASGDFNVSLPWANRKDEIGQIAEAAKMVAERVGATISDIKSSAREVTNVSAEISTSTTDLSQRTEEQAASLEETSASMEEIGATVKKNAENAQQANQSAAGTRDVAGRGGQVVAEAVTAMAKIEESSRKIADIIGVIDEIARQTNLLALNAAVEAARAGDAGRGFAVVASEVRSLAQRSSQAAKDIKNLITNSSVRVKEGVDLVNRAGTSLDEIVESIKKVAEIIADIANASIEQSAGIDQVNKALTQMDEVTQQNSALVQQNAATAKTLEHQAKAMDERVAFFQLDESAVSGGVTRTVVTAAVPAHKTTVFPAAKPTPSAARQANGAAKRGPVGHMQSALATAIKQAPDWKEF
jgi:methyl-accepting chemotaxis protein